VSIARLLLQLLMLSDLSCVSSFISSFIPNTDAVSLSGCHWASRDFAVLKGSVEVHGGALQCGPGGPWPTQNFGWMGHIVFGHTNKKLACMFVSSSSVKLVKKQMYVAITASCGFGDKLTADRIFAGISKS